MKYKQAIGRSTAVIIMVLVSAVGISWAALQSQPAKLTGNTIETASANLVISTDNTNFAAALPGFDFNNLVPGGAAVPGGGYSFTLKNSSAINVNLKFAVSSTPSNPAGVDLGKVNVILTPSGGSPQSFSLQALVNSNASGGLTVTNPSIIFAGTRQAYNVQVSMAVDALSGASASLGNIDLAFTAVAVTS